MSRIVRFQLVNFRIEKIMVDNKTDCNINQYSSKLKKNTNKTTKKYLPNNVWKVDNVKPETSDQPELETSALKCHYL